MSGYLTQAEAKKKRCPRSICAVIFGDVDSETHSEFMLDRYCRGEECMAWRETPEQPKRFFHAVPAAWRGEKVGPRNPGVPLSYEWSNGGRLGDPGWLEPEAEYRERRLGFCGLCCEPKGMVKP